MAINWLTVRIVIIWVLLGHFLIDSSIYLLFKTKIKSSHFERGKHKLYRVSKRLDLRYVMVMYACMSIASIIGAIHDRENIRKYLK